ncbi:MAG: HK97-gp10 family putative phage morphogenesis protein [Eubacteriaceae bacterium]
MGKFDFHFNTELSRKLERLSNFDEIAGRMLNESVPILEKHVVAEASKHRRTGALVNSIKKTSAYKNKYGWFVTVRPTGKDKKGVRNMEKMAYAEFGTSKQPPEQILTKAINDARDEVTDKMQQIFNEEIEK